MKLAFPMLVPLLALAPLAHAGSYSTSPVLLSTNMHSTGTGKIPGFDASLGTLDSVQIVVDRIYAQFPIEAENLDTQRTMALFGTVAAPAEYGYRFGINSYDTIGIARAALPPFAAPLSAYDGTTDFSGLSGITTLVTGVAYNIVCEPTSDPAVLSEAHYRSLWMTVTPRVNLWVPHSLTGHPFALGKTDEPRMRAKMHVVYTYH